jgi:hypothetical protein
MQQPYKGGGPSVQARIRARCSKTAPRRNESFINPGDSVEIRSPAIGSLRTRVVDKRET